MMLNALIKTLNLNKLFSDLVIIIIKYLINFIKYFLTNIYMSFTNLKYDTPAYEHDLRESVGMLDYKLNTPQQCEECFPSDPNVTIQRAGVSVDANRSMIDIDSDLSGLTRKATNDPAQKFLPDLNSNGLKYKEGPKIHFDDCNLPKVENTFLSNPSSNLRGTGWNRWESLCHDPQANLEHPFEWNTNSNLLARDNHRPCLHEPNDSNGLFPSRKSDPVEEPIQKVDYVPTEPVSVQWRKLSEIKKY